MANQMSLSKRRRTLINLFYRYLLLEKDYNYIRQDLLDETQGNLDELTFNHATSIASESPTLIIAIKNHLNRNQSWNRLPFLVRSILLVGTYEIHHTDIPKAVTINEMTQLAKDYGLNNHYRFVNALLDKLEKK